MCLSTTCCHLLTKYIGNVHVARKSERFWTWVSCFTRREFWFADLELKGYNQSWKFSSPFPNNVSGLFTRGISEINQNDWGNIPSRQSYFCFGIQSFQPGWVKEEIVHLSWCGKSKKYSQNPAQWQNLQDDNLSLLTSRDKQPIPAHLPAQHSGSAGRAVGGIACGLIDDYGSLRK